MMITSPRFITFAAVATLALPSANGQPAANIVGKWTNQSSEGGARTEMSLQFFPNGTYAHRLVIVSEFGWTQQGNVLLLAPLVGTNNGSPQYGKATAVQMVLDGDNLTISDAEQTIAMKRVTVPVNEAAILGRWEGKSKANEGVVQDFLADGRLLITITMLREAGRYSADGKNIRWEEQIPQPRSRKTRFRLENDKLTIFLKPEAPVQLIRAPASASN
jgi:hypothetical protein